MRIVKRNGEIVPFDSKKIYHAVRKALVSSNESSNIDVDSQKVTDDVCKRLPDIITVESVQDIVEFCLMADQFYFTAKKYILYREERNKNRDSNISLDLSHMYQQSSSFFDKDVMREFVFFRTYSRWKEDVQRRETWIECVDRYMDFMKENISDVDYNELRIAILKQEVMPSMRLLQFAGKAARRCNACIYNCSYTAPENFKDLGDIMYLLMSGTGVGFSVEKKNISKFPMIEKQKGVVHDYTIEDSKEGWADSLQFGLEKWFSGEDVNFDYSKLRPLGARLNTSGGRSSGPQPLIDLLDFTRSTVFKQQGHKLSCLNVHDIICKIGQVVVAGGNRRSACISLSDISDPEIRDCKKGAFWNTNPQRCMANNSAVYNEKPPMIEFMKEWLSLAESGSGERGIFNRGGLSATLPKRRLTVLENDTSNLGSNPCAEIILQPRQFCNLTEVICREDDTVETLLNKVRIATILGTYQATLTNYRYISPEWKKTQEQERLLGVSLTGQWDCPALRNPEVFQTLREKAIEVNLEYSKKFGINQSTCITAVKPSGTVSQMTNTSSGIHQRFSKYYIRRIRISSSDPLFAMMKDQGVPFHPEVGQSLENANTFVLDFPVKSPKNSICVNETNAIEQLEYWKMVKTHYTEHNPSVTIYVKENEWLDVASWIWKNWDFVCGISFLPYSDHVYQLAPYEAIDEEKYNNLISTFPEIDFSKLIHYEKYDTTDVKKEMACVGGACEL